MSSSSASSSSGVGFLGLLTVGFVILKLTGHIAWSWLWVLAPIWIPIALVILGFSIWIALAIKPKRKKK